jgi:membrane protein
MIERFVSRVVDLLPRSLGKVVRDAGDEDVLLFASGLAFHALVSVAPMTIAVLWVTSLFLRDSEIQQLATTIGDAAPDGLGAGEALTEVARLGTDIGLPALIVGLWPATAYGAGVRRGFARLAGEEKRLKGLRGRGLLLVVLLPLFVIGALLGSYLGTTLVEWKGVGHVLAVVAALGVGFGAGAISIALLYRIFSSKPLSWRSIRHATYWTAGAISAASLLFTLYLTVGANFQEHFATSGVAGIVLLGVWLYVSNALLLMGYQLALAYEKRK